MVPFPMLPTDSSAERRLYEAFLEQLGDDFVVYHSVDWALAGGDRPEQGEADFVIAHPELGILALEVKGGDIGYDRAAGRWTQTGRDGPHHLDEDPFHQARDEMRSLERILGAQSGAGDWAHAIGFGVAFPDARYGHAERPDAPAEIVIDREDLRRLDERVPDVMRHWRRPGEPASFGPEGMRALATALGFRMEIREPLRLRFDEEDRKIVELTEDQSWVLSFVANRTRAAVTGPAGSGKTLLALQIARRLAARGHRTLLTCFSERLAAHLRETATDRGLDVLEFHDLCRQTIARAGLEAPSSESELPGLLADAAARIGPRYEAMVVDEAQHMRSGWWPALLALHRDPDEGMLYVFTDDNPRVDGSTPPIAPEHHVDRLRHNLRGSKEIGEFVSVFYEGERRLTPTGPSARPVEILDYDDEGGLTRLLATVLHNLIEQEGLRLDDLAILSPTDEGTSRLLARRESAGHRLAESAQPGTLLTSSVRAFEGLERSVVILAELGTDPDDLDDLRGSLYVGASRARDHLIVLATRPVARELRRLAGITSH
jgi:hypothetical protein